jgi:hypothetical protein
MVNIIQYKNTIINFRNNLNNISKNMEYYLEKTINVGREFGGPSVFFHKKVLLEQKSDFLGETHLNMIYAVMPSWGMHRMGSKGAKMVDYDVFEKEIMKNKNEIIGLKDKNYRNVDINIIAKLITEKVHVSTSNSFLVSSSKVLHHILPNIISPIDRNYSIRFMKKNKNDWGSNTINYSNEEAYTLIFLNGMYEFLNKNEDTMSKYIIQINENNIYNNNFNTSLTKIFDNLIMVYVKEYKGEIFE